MALLITSLLFNLYTTDICCFLIYFHFLPYKILIIPSVVYRVMWTRTNQFYQILEILFHNTPSLLAFEVYIQSILSIFTCQSHWSWACSLYFITGIAILSCLFFMKNCIYSVYANNCYYCLNNVVCCSTVSINSTFSVYSSWKFVSTWYMLVWLMFLQTSGEFRHLFHKGNKLFLHCV